MRSWFSSSFPKVGDALNGVAAATRQVAVSTPFRPKGKKAKAVFALVVVCILWGTTWVASKEGVRHMPALQLAGIRQTIGGLLYVLFFLAKGAALPKGKEWGPILVLSILNFGLSNGLSTWGVKYISAGLGSIIGAIFPLCIVVISFFRSKTAARPATILGLVLGFTGICVIFYEHLNDFLNADFRFGILISLIASWSWAFGTLYTKEHAVRFNPYFALGLQMLISGPALYLISTLTHNSIPFLSIPRQSWMAIGYLSVFSSVLSFVAYLYALQNLPTEQVAIYAYVNPVVAYIISAVLFGEQITFVIMLGVVITLYGVFRVNRSLREERVASGK